jgi:hypothetical protein
VSKDDPYGLPEVIIEHNRARFGVFSWQGQAPQYDQLGPPGEIVYRRYFDGRPLDGKGKAIIDTLLHYDDRGYLDGILNTYPFGAANADGSKLDDPGDVTLTLRPDVDTPGGGVRALLVADALRRWPDITVEVEVEVELDRTILATGPLDGTVIVPEPGIHGVPVDGNRRIMGRLPNL